MNGNPKKAVAAVLPGPVRGEGWEVRPMTLGLWAALERIGSPLVTGEEATDALALLPSLYLLTHGGREVFRGNLLELAMAWAETVPVTALADIRAAAERQMKTVADVVPEEDAEAAARRKKATGRSPSSWTGRPASTAGGTRR